LERSGLIDLTKIQARNYEKFSLKRNPFPAIGVPEETLLITADREMVIKRFQNVMRELIDGGRSIVTVMVGEYGSGKSHLLKLFKMSVDTQLFPSEGIIAVYVKSPGEDFSYLLFGFIDNLGFEFLSQLSKKYLRQKLLSDDRFTNLIFDVEMRDAFVNGRARLDETLNKTRILELIDHLKKTDFQGLDSDLTYAFLLLSHPQLQQVAWRWLIGETLDRDEKDLLGVSASLDPKKAYKMFVDIRKILKNVGIKKMLILIDELEKITLLSNQKEDKYQDDLRKLIDDNPENVSFYFAIAPKQWKELTREPTALVRRLKGNWHLLEDFRESDTRELIEKYLFSVRTDLYNGDKVRSAHPDIEPSLFPFTIPAVSLIGKETKGVVSDILLVCRKSLEVACDSTDLEIIDVSTVQQALQNKI
jgi:hypothetical protein